MTDEIPLLSNSRTPGSSVHDCVRVGVPHAFDGPTEARSPARPRERGVRSFEPRRFPPVATRAFVKIALHVHSSLPPAHAARICSHMARDVLDGHCERRARFLAESVRGSSGVRAPFFTFRKTRAWL